MPSERPTQKRPIRLLLAAFVVVVILATIVLLSGTQKVATTPGQPTAGETR